MVQANRGAFMESKTVNVFIDRMIYFLMIEYQTYWQGYYKEYSKEIDRGFIDTLVYLVKKLGEVSLGKNDIYHKMN